MSVIGLTAKHHFYILCHPLWDDNKNLIDMPKSIINLFFVASITVLLIGCSAQKDYLPANIENNNTNIYPSSYRTDTKSNLINIYGIYRYNSLEDEFDLDVDNQGILLVLPLNHYQSQFKGRIVIVQTCLWTNRKNKITVYDNIECHGNLLVQNEKVLFTVEFDNNGQAEKIKGKSPYLQNNISEVRLSNEYVRIVELP